MTERSVQLYLPTSVRSAARLLTSGLDPTIIACVLLRQGSAPASAAALGETAQALRVHGPPVLLEDDVTLARESGCDGVHLSNPNDYRAARAQLGAEAIVGVGCGDSRHAAMVAGEAGADYVAFGSLSPAAELADVETLTGWQLLMTVPCVGLGAQTLEDGRALAQAGADFVMVEEPLWLKAAEAGETWETFAAALDARA